MSKFLNAVMSKDTVTANGALSNSTSGNGVLDYFAKSGMCRGRSETDVNADMAKIFGENPLEALKVVFYNRMVTRRAKGINDGETENVQRGQGQKDEFIKSLKWLENNKPDLLYKNLSLVPIVGCWKDLWYDSSATNYFHYVNKEQVYALIEVGIKSQNHRALIAKFLPKIRSAKNVKNERHKRKNAWAKGLCKFLGWTEEDYRKFKSSPENNAHLWQRQMAAKEWNSINFNTIPGRALTQFISKGKDGKSVIERHELTEKYLQWIKSKPVAKFTGYPYELFLKAKNDKRSLVERFTYDAQFQGLLEKAKDNVNKDLLKRGVLCALDTSGSMGSFHYYGGSGTNMACQPIDVCLGLGIFFSSLIEGAFKDHVVMFDSVSKMVKLTGSLCDKVDQLKKQPVAWGGTNFQSVIDEIVRVRKHNPKIPVEDYPGVLLVVSDMQFNPTGNDNTNYEEAMRKLAAVGLPKMTIIWWNVNAYGKDVPSKMDDAGTVLISGMDGSVVSLILEGESEKVVDKETGEQRKLNPLEMMKIALDQEILNFLEV